jgi:hypothetical protein
MKWYAAIFLIVVSLSVLFLNPGTYFVFLKVATLALFRIKWLAVVQTLFGA